MPIRINCDACGTELNSNNEIEELLKRHNTKGQITEFTGVVTQTICSLCFESAKRLEAENEFLKIEIDNLRTGLIADNKIKGLENLISNLELDKKDLQDQVKFLDLKMRNSDTVIANATRELQRESLQLKETVKRLNSEKNELQKIVDQRKERTLNPNKKDDFIIL